MRMVLTEREAKEIEEVTGLANEYDKTCYSAPLDADGYLFLKDGGELVSYIAVYKMGDTFSGRPVDECLMFTKPEDRGRGHMRKLFGRLSSGNKSVLRFSAYENHDTESYLRHIGSVHESDELLMVLRLSEKGGNLPEDELHRENRHSECYVRTGGDRAYIYGVRTDESHLRKGHAKSLLRDVLSELSDMGASKAVLEVSSSNTPALMLYRSLEFCVEQKLCIWYNTVSVCKSP